MKYRVNRDLLVDQMTALGLSERQLLIRTSVPVPALRRARIEGYIYGHMNVQQLVELADVLCVSLDDLLARDHSREDERTQDPSDDSRTVVALLFGARRLVDTGRLARAMGWDTPRLLSALDGVPTALKGTGLRLATSGASVAVQPERQPDKAMRQALATAQGSRTGLSTIQANVLRRILDGRHIGARNRNPSNTDRLVMGALKNLGYIEPDDHGHYQATAAVRLALDLK